MDTETVNLLTELAAKLGTTSEYLWEILLRQAPISSTVTLIQIMFTVLSGIFLWRLHKHFSKKIDKKYSMYDNSTGVLEAIMIILSILTLTIGIGLFLGIENMLNGYFNPEYWALKQILNILK